MTYDRTAYRGRNVMKRAFNGFNTGAGWPPDTTSTRSFYRGGLVLAAVLLWLTDLGDTS